MKRYDDPGVRQECARTGLRPRRVLRMIKRREAEERNARTPWERRRQTREDDDD